MLICKYYDSCNHIDTNLSTWPGDTWTQRISWIKLWPLLFSDLLHLA